MDPRLEIMVEARGGRGAPRRGAGCHARSSRPRSAAAKAGNWIRTLPGKGWFTLLRLYSPEECFFDKTWRPTEIQLVK